MYARSTTGAGFTIVETLIFLAISGLMFVLAINAMSGKQQQTEFNTAVDTLSSELNQDLSNVGNGNYATLDNYACSVPANSNAYSLTAGGSPDGSCTVIGEIITFSAAGANGQESYTVLPVIGRNYQNSTNPPQVATNLTEAVPFIPISTANIAKTVVMPFGLTIVGSPDQPTTISTSGLGAFGIFSFTFTSFAGGSPSTNQMLNSGSEHIEFFGLPSSVLGDTPSAIASIVNDASTGLTNCTSNSSYVCAGSDNDVIDPYGGITFCVQSGTTSKQSALFTVGGSDSPSSASYRVYGDGAC